MIDIEESTTPTPEGPNALCAFTVVVDGDGSPRIFRMGIEGVIAFREPTQDDVFRALLQLNSQYQAKLVADQVAESMIAALPGGPEMEERVSAALADTQASD